MRSSSVLTAVLGGAQFLLQQDVGALDVGGAASNFATVGCGVGALDPPPRYPRATPATNVVPFHFWDVW